MKKLKMWIFGKPYRSAGLFVLRLTFGAGLVYHGFGKVFGNMDGFAAGVAKLGFPFSEFFAWAAALSEFVGGLLFAAGFLTRPAALMIFTTMFVAAFVRHGSDPFGVKELALAYMCVALTVMISGAGRWSVDHLINQRLLGWYL